MTDDSHVLKPTALSVDKTKTTSLDKFGQSYNSDDDLSKWSDITPALTRKMHSRADTDLSPNSLHHTLGIKHSQASPGDHTHNGVTSKKIGPLEKTSSGSQAEWILPVAYTIEDIANLLDQFVELRILGSPSLKEGVELVSFVGQSLLVKAINFPEAYPVGVIPVVMTNIESTAGTTIRWGSRSQGITNTGFNLFVFKGDAADADQTWSNVPVSWLAYSS